MMNNKVDYNTYSDYAIILPDGMILFGSVMADFLAEAIRDDNQAQEFMQFFWKSATKQTNNHYFDIGGGIKIQIVKRSWLRQSNNPVICN